ncbi:MAG: hypothetical protein M1113_00110 [Candidatus Thermoplasmatota archaeon]|nr:hypothetical protein [Candidatus Thermoplasmatota archaeon]
MIYKYKSKIRRNVMILYVIVTITVLLASSVGFNVGMFGIHKNGPVSQDIKRSTVVGSGSFIITITETGLNDTNSNGYYGAEWGVHLSNAIYNITKHSSTDVITFNVSAGTYDFYVLSEPDYGVDPQTGLINVTNSNVALSINFVPKLFYVVFSETGLPAVSATGPYGSEWAVNLSGIVRYSNTSSITFLEENGSYNFKILSMGAYAPVTPIGTVIVNGSDQSVSVPFQKRLYDVTFSETGLPLAPVGTEWFVNVVNKSLGINITQDSFSNFLTVSVPNAIYTYSIASPSTFFATPESGSINVSSENYLIPISFYRSLYIVTFSETGLPQNGTSTGSAPPVWTVTLKNMTSGQSFTTTISGKFSNISLPDGTYKYTIGSFSGFIASPSTGNLYVDNAFYRVNIVFSSTHRYVAFKESGLFNQTNANPVPGSYGTFWSVTLVNTTSHVSITEGNDSSSLIFWVLPGSYSFAVRSVDGFTISTNATGNIDVISEYKQVNVSFKLSTTLGIQRAGRTINITFSEHGLIAGTLWSVALSNSSLNSSLLAFNTGNITFTVTNGTYYYRVMDVGFMHPVVASHVFVSNGSLNQRVIVTFVNVSNLLVVKETGLPALQVWSLTLKNSHNKTVTYASPYGLNEIPLLNGTYYYHIELSGTYFLQSNYSGFLNINGTSLYLNLTFHSLLHPVQMNELGLARGTSWSFAVLGSNETSIQYSSTFGTIPLYLPNGTYMFRMVNSGNFTPVDSTGYFVVNGSTMVIINTTFVSLLHAVTFKESGLRTNSQWSVTFGGITQVTTLGSITFMVPQGTYDYRTLSIGQLMPSNYSGTVFVSLSNLEVEINYHSQVHLVTINETGLLAGTKWSVSINDITMSSTGTQVKAELQNGTYYYNVVQQGYYIPSPTDGLLDLLNSNYQINLTFTPYIYNSTIMEIGLPSGTNWTFSLYGHNGLSYTITTNNSTYSILVPNGTYLYVITPVGSYIPSPSTYSFNIHGAPNTLTVTFKIYRYLLTFQEKNLPPGITWGVNLVSGTGVTYSNNTTGSQVTFNLTNETYTYSIISQNKTWGNSTVGSVIINGQPVDVTVNFTEFVYTATFDESGIHNTNWTLTVNGQTYQTNKTSINVTLPNGTYTYSVGNVSGYTVSPESGKFIVSGSSLTIRVTYTIITHVIKSPPPPVTPKYNTFIVIGTLVGVGVIGLAVITVLYYQRKRI